jgi:hypothetical protein
MRINPVVETILGIFVLCVCGAILYLEHAEGSPSCANSQCTIELPNSKEFRLNQVCDMQQQSDDTLINCVFDTKGDEKVDCYTNLRQLDKEVLKLERAYKKDFKEYAVCQDSFRKQK